MKILLQPNNKKESISLKDVYDQAIAEATELFIVSAYLTSWQPKHKLPDKCRELTFIVGTDFGLTRSDACKKVLNWLPEGHKNDLLAADHLDGFHPKLVMWQSDGGQKQLLLGSSNLSRAAVSTNYEANVLFKISDNQYTEIREWIYQIGLGCSPISEDWLEQYKEAIRPPKGTGGKKPPIVSFELLSGPQFDKAIRYRRNQHRKFAEIESELLSLIQKCASGALSNKQFYEKMMALWGHHASRLQGKGFEIVGKHGDWQGVCKSISVILEVSSSASIQGLDNRVRKEIDHLVDVQNPNRGAWLSEMLCHFFPDRYPLLNGPVKAWLQHNNYRGPRKASEGSRYIDLALKLRKAIKQNNSNKAKNLLELDHAIWQWYALNIKGNRD
jgi:hypothetical protein